MKKLVRVWAAGWSLFLLSLLAQSAQAAPVVYGFDDLQDQDRLSNQWSGLSFFNALALKVGQSLNVDEFPPRSGDTAVLDDGGALEILFAQPVFSVGAYFTYFEKLSFFAYDAGGGLLGSVHSLFSSNLLLSGDVGSLNNEFVSFSDSAGRIARVVIQGGSLGSSMVMDDLTVEFRRSVPEPQSWALVALALLAAAVARRRHFSGLSR